MPETFEHPVVIDAPAAQVWERLATPALMPQGMGGPGMALVVETARKVG